MPEVEELDWDWVLEEEVEMEFCVEGETGATDFDEVSLPSPTSHSNDTVTF